MGVPALFSSATTYLFQLELRNLLIVLCSTQLYTPHTTAYPGAVSVSALPVVQRAPTSKCFLEADW